MAVAEHIEQVPLSSSKARVDPLNLIDVVAYQSPLSAVMPEPGIRMMAIGEYVQIWGDCEDA